MKIQKLALALGCALAVSQLALAGEPFSKIPPYVKGSLADTKMLEAINPNFKKAFDFLRKTDLAALKDGRVEIDGENVYANVSTPTLAYYPDGGEIEVHRQYIDIHVPIVGEETLGAYTMTDAEFALPFNEKDDYALFRAKDVPVTVKAGEFVAFLPPYGAHRPGCTMQKPAPANYRKLCVKVRSTIELKGLTQVYENPIPQLRSRQAIFPNLCELPNGNLLCCFVLAEAFEAADMRNYLAESTDGGKTWSKPWRMFKEGAVPESESCKCTPLGGNRVMALGYAAKRTDPELPLGNPKTGGLLSHRVFYGVSEDCGRTWSEKVTIPDAWKAQTEASAPVVRLKDGSLAAPITGFPNWEGKMNSRVCGRMLVTHDEGKTWNDDVVCMDFGDSSVSCYEQRFCVLDSGTVVNVGWNEDLASGKRLPNHVTWSADNGKTWSKPLSTGIMGQAASVCALGGEKFAVIVARRRDTDAPGIYCYVCDFGKRTWNVLREGIVWSAGAGPLKRDKNMAEVFGFLKFGQPAVTKLHDGRLMLCFWYQKEGQYHVAVGEVAL